MLEKLLPEHIYNEIKDLKNLNEIRLRIDSIIKIGINEKYFSLLSDKIPLKCTKDDIMYILRVATENSFYKYENTINQGYISYFGYRIGIAGEGVMVNGDLITIKNISSITIRVPNLIDFKNLALDELIHDFDNTIILSKPGLGKTTLLRYLIKRLSKDKNVLVLDERDEISFSNTIKLGENVDVILNIPKKIAYKTFVRVLAPDIIATDEIFGEDEVDSIIDLIRCGVKVIATLHTSSITLINQKIYAKLIDSMRYVIIISKIGHIEKIIDKK